MASDEMWGKLTLDVLGGQHQVEIMKAALSSGDISSKQRHLMERVTVIVYSSALSEDGAVFVSANHQEAGENVTRRDAFEEVEYFAL